MYTLILFSCIYNLFCFVFCTCASYVKLPSGSTIIDCAHVDVCTFIENSCKTQRTCVTTTYHFPFDRVGVVNP